jgi:anti-sigma B factor antagonist
MELPVCTLESRFVTIFCTSTKSIVRNSLPAPLSNSVPEKKTPMPDATPVLTLEIERNGEVSTVHLHGRLVFGSTDILSDPVRKLIPTSKRIILDLADLTVMDSIGLGVLTRLFISARSAGCELQLLHLRERIRELLALTNLLSVFSVIGEQGVKII